MAQQEPKEIGLNTKRGCRDIVFLILFIIYWIGMFIVAQAAVASGDIRQIMYAYRNKEFQKTMLVTFVVLVANKTRLICTILILLT
jgi:hypothetical protein